MHAHVQFKTSDAPAFTVCGVIPTFAHKIGSPVHFESDDVAALQWVPWHVTSDDMVHSYRVTFLATGGTDEARIYFEKGDAEQKPFALNDVQRGALTPITTLKVGYTSVRGIKYESLLFANPAMVADGPSEKCYRSSGAFSDGVNESGGFTLHSYAWPTEPYICLEMVFHNANFLQASKADIWHYGLDWEVPDGYEVIPVDLDPNHLEDGTPYAHILPMQSVRVARYVIAPIGAQVSLMDLPENRTFRLLESGGLHHGRPELRAANPQGLPVEASEEMATQRANELEATIPFGKAVDGWSSPTHGVRHQCEYYVEGTPYGGAGSSVGQERFGEVALGLHGHSEQLWRWVQLSMHRHPCFLIDPLGRPFNGDDHTQGGSTAATWQFFQQPGGRGIEGSTGRSYPSNLWYGARDPFGYTTPVQLDQDYALGNEIDCPYAESIFNYGAYDLQHGKRALRALIPSAFLCGNRTSKDLLRFLAGVARCDFWDGESNGPTATDYDNRVLALYEEAMAEPGTGLNCGREDAFAIDTVISALCLNSSASERLQYLNWLSKYAHAFATAQMPIEFESGEPYPNRGIVRADHGSKELAEWDYLYEVSQPYQESMVVGWGGGAMMHWWGLYGAPIIAGSYLAIAELAGTPPVYKLAVRRNSDGLICTSKAVQSVEGFPSSSATQSDHMPSFASVALTHSWSSAGLRTRIIDALWRSLGLGSKQDLLTWQPPNQAMLRQSASIPPLVKWLDEQGLF